MTAEFFDDEIAWMAKVLDLLKKEPRMIDIDRLAPGPELDALVLTRVMGMKIADASVRATRFVQMGDTVHPDHVPKFSTVIAVAWEIVEKLAPLVGDFRYADGFFILQYADSADHGEHEAENPCSTMRLDEDFDDDDVDRLRWSCHLHLGGLCEKPEGTYPPGWDHGKKFCARGETAAHAICRAALKAVGV